MVQAGFATLVRTIPFVDGGKRNDGTEKANDAAKTESPVVILACGYVALVNRKAIYYPPLPFFS